MTRGKCLQPLPTEFTVVTMEMVLKKTYDARKQPANTLRVIGALASSVEKSMTTGKRRNCLESCILDASIANNNVATGDEKPTSNFTASGDQ